MKHFRLLSLLLMIALLIPLTGISGPTAAQNGESDWFIYLYNPQINELLRVNANGSTASYALDIPEGTFISPYQMSFTDDGSQVAYCSQTYRDDGSHPDATLVVYDIAADSTLLEAPLGSQIGCVVGQDGLKGDGSQVAVGTIHNYPGAPGSEESEQPLWQLRVFDVALGSTIHQLTPDDPRVADLLEIAPQFGSVMLYPEDFSGDTLVFRETPWGTGGAPDLPAYTWNLTSDTLESTPYLGKIFIDRLADGTLAWGEYNPDLPSGQAAGPMPLNNVLMVAPPDGEPQMVYHNPEELISGVRFINNGRDLAINLLPNFDFENPEANPRGSRWIKVDRSGAVTELIDYVEFTRIEAAPGGYITYQTTYEDTDNRQNPISRLFYHDYELGGEFSLLWEINQDGWELAWITPSVPAPDLPSFTPAP